MPGSLQGQRSPEPYGAACPSVCGLHSHPSCPTGQTCPLYLWGLCQSLLPPPGCAAAPGARGSSWGTQALPVCITPAQCLINCRQEGRTGSREGRGGERGAGQGEVAEGGSWQPCLCGPTNRATQLLAPGRTSPSGWHRTNLLAAAKGLSNTRTGVR